MDGIMKHLILLLFLIIFPVRLYSQGNYKKIYKEAITHWVYKEYDKAKKNFVDLYSDPDLAMYQDTIAEWIKACDKRIARRNELTEKARLARIEKRKNDNYYHVSVLTSNYEDISNSTKAAIDEILRLNNKALCPNIDDALYVVSVFYDINESSIKNGFYNATGSGYVILGNTLEDKTEIGDWSVDCAATSALSMDDAKRIVRNKINYQLSYALDNILNGRPQNSNYYIPEQSISVYFAQDNNYSDESLSFLRESINSYISKTPGMTVITALDKTKNEERDNIAKTQSIYVKREGLAPVHELDGFAQTLRLSVTKDGNYVNFIAEISELGTGKSLTTVTIKGSDFNITDNLILSSKGQELAAKLLAVGLGFRQWEIGEDLGQFKLVSFDGLHGVILRSNESTCRKYDINAYRKAIRRKGDINADKWRFPSLADIEALNNKNLQLENIYWTEFSPSNGYHTAYDFYNKKEIIIKDSNHKTAAVLLLRNF